MTQVKNNFFYNRTLPLTFDNSLISVDDTTGRYVRFPHNEKFDFNNSSLSISFFVNLQSSFSTNGALFSKGIVDEDVDNSFNVKYSTLGTITTTVNLQTTTVPVPYGIVDFSGVSAGNYNQWVHYAVSVDVVNQEFKVFKNGSISIIEPVSLHLPGITVLGVENCTEDLLLFATDTLVGLEYAKAKLAHISIFKSVLNDDDVEYMVDKGGAIPESQKQHCIFYVTGQNVDTFDKINDI